MDGRKFTIPDSFLHPESMDHMLKRIAHMVSGDEWYCSKTNGRYVESNADATDWQMGRANDFWLHRIDIKTFEIVSRYGSPDMVFQLRNVIVWMLGLNGWNEWAPIPARRVAILERELSHAIGTIKDCAAMPVDTSRYQTALEGKPVA